MCAHTSVCRLQHCTAPPEAALRGWCQRVSPSQVSLGTHSHCRHFSLSFSLSGTHSHMLKFSHACAQCYPHHKLMSHYSVISVLFAPPCLSAICHTVGTIMTQKLSSFSGLQHAHFHSSVHALVPLCRFVARVLILSCVIKRFCMCVPCNLFPLVKNRRALNLS